MSDMLAMTSATAGVFILLVVLRAAIHKALDFGEFQGFVADYQLLPEAVVAPLAKTLMLGEFVLAALIAWPATRSVGLWLSVLLFVAYAVAVGVNLGRGHTRIECGCGGAPQVLSASLLWRNGVLLALALFAAIVSPQVLGVAEAGVVVAAGVFALVLYALFEQINANRMYLKSRGPV